MPPLPAPRVRITEQPPAARSIQGVSTSVYGLIGIFEKGPIGIPTFVAGPNDAHRLFGRPIQDGNGMRALDLYFDQGGQQAYVTRIAHYKNPAKPKTLTAKTASTDLKGNPTRKAASAFVSVLKTDDKKQATLKLNGVAFTVEKKERADTMAELLKQAINNSENKRIRGVVTASINPKHSTLVTLTAIKPGKGGNAIKLESNQPKTAATSGHTFTGGNDGEIQTVITVRADDGPGTHANTRTIRVTKDNDDPNRFALTIFQHGVQRDHFPKLSMDPNDADFVETRVNKRGERLIAVKTHGKTPPDPGDYPMYSGDDGLKDIDDADFIGDETAGTGMYAWKTIESEFALASIPDRPTPKTQKAALEFCEKQRHFLYVIDINDQLDYREAVAYKRNNALQSNHAAFPYPFLKMESSATETVLFPSSPGVLGAMARTDVIKGIAKTAAGTEDGRISNVIGLANDATQQQSVRDYLYQAGINPLWVKPGVGVFNDGALLSQPDGFVRFVTQRRVLIYIESSLKEGLRFVLHENICERLYHRINATITTFLTRVWQQGGLRGNTANEAFFIDTSHGPGTLNPPESEEEGRVNVSVGLATLKPAQFVNVALTLTQPGTVQTRAA